MSKHKTQHVIKVYIHLGDAKNERKLRIVLNATFTQFVNKLDNSDLAIFDREHETISTFQPNTTYVFLSDQRINEKSPPLPINAAIIPTPSAEKRLLQILMDLQNKIKPIATQNTP